MSLFNTIYKVHGFRSLIDFSIELTPGINVLVGPNGSGKTNFIEFLDFLDTFIKQGASNAVSMAGGVARVFSVENFKKSTPSLDCEISGIARISASDSYDNLDKYFKFRYYVEIKFSKRESRIYVSREKLTVFKVFSLDELETAPHHRVGSIHIARTSAENALDGDINIASRIFAENFRNPFFYKRRLQKNKKISEIFDRNDIQSLESDQSLLSKRIFFSAIDSIRYSVTRGKSYNIIPDKARSADHISRYGAIERDGSGLSSILHHLRRIQQHPESRPSYFLEKVPDEGFSMVVHWTSLIFPELSDISIVQDLHLGKYIVTLVIGHDKPLKIPIQAASDGTVKWLALVTLIIAGGGLGCIEEPENFLHPKMQVFLLDLLREHNSYSLYSFFILSTHSESIINNCNPEEVVIFRFSDEGTLANRISNPDTVRQEINKTGFGLGYYYAANALW